MAAPALTLGESMAHLSRTEIWVWAVFLQIAFPVGFTSFMAYVWRREFSPSFFSSVPWRLPLLISHGAYMSVLLLVMSYADLFLPRTPVTVAEKLRHRGTYGGGFGVLVMVTVVFATEVRDTRVLVGCTCVAAACIAGLVAFWVWLARTYGGAPDSSTAQAAQGQQPPRLPI